jgi:hypothetical protein
MILPHRELATKGHEKARKKKKENKPRIARRKGIKDINLIRVICVIGG